MRIRPGQDADLDAVAAVYSHEVETSVSTFDLVPPPRGYWEARLTSTEPGDHLLVADQAGEVLGYAYSSAYRPRPAYLRTRERHARGSVTSTVAGSTPPGCS